MDCSRRNPRVIRSAAMALAALDETQALWHVANKAVWRTDYQYLDKEPEDALLNIPIDSGDVQSFNGNLQVYIPQDTPDVEKSNAILNNAMRWARIYGTTMRGFVNPGTYAASKAFISMSESGNKRSSTMQPYDQFEVAIPIDKAGDCLKGVVEEIYGPKNLFTGFRTPGLIRFIPGEEFYLSPSNGHPVMYINIEDHLSMSSGVQNKEFDEVLDYFLDQCDARLHWGKAGWPTHQPCFDGAEDYPESWCDFGCAVQELDPGGKFRSESDVWRWSASRAGSAVEFSSCCSSSGFLKSECVCERTPIC